MEFDCAAWYLSTLQHLLLVPSYDLMGKQMWERIEHAVSHLRRSTNYNKHELLIIFVPHGMATNVSLSMTPIFVLRPTHGSSPINPSIHQFIQVHEIVVPASERDYALTLANMRQVLGWKERVQELSQEAAEASRSAEIARDNVERLEAAMTPEAAARAAALAAQRASAEGEEVECIATLADHTDWVRGVALAPGGGITRTG